jgi:hypothetical protein
LEEESIREKIQQAIDIVKDIDDQFQIPAFKTVLNFLLKSEQRYSDPQTILTPQKESKPSVLTLPEMLAISKQKKYADKAILAVLYLFEYENVQNFNANHIIEEFSKAKTPRPANMTDTLNNLIKRGFLREGPVVDGNKGFELTEKGKEYAESLLATAKDS